jgi:hypothetical protein
LRNYNIGVKHTKEAHKNKVLRIPTLNEKDTKNGSDFRKRDPEEGNEESRYRDNTSMNTKYLPINHHRKGQKIKHIGKNPPHFCPMILSQTLTIKSIRLRHAPRFMIPPYQVYAVGIAQLETCEEGDGFNGEVASVDIVA